MASHQKNEIAGRHQWPLYGALGVVLLTFVLVVGGVYFKDTDTAAKETAAQLERTLYFLDGTNGQVVVYDARTRQKLGTFGKGEGAFVRISMRSMMRQRTLKEIDHTHPFRLVKSSNGLLSITDPQSGGHIQINAFGPIAIESFARFLPTNHSAQGAEG
ncbi:MAG: photosynthetic complex assembly protein PuhC [Pseudomonadota bacterium]